QPHPLAAAELRLQARRRRARSLLVASACFRRSRQRARRRRLGARARALFGGRGARLRARGPHRAVAAAVAEKGAGDDAAVKLAPSQSLPRLRGRVGWENAPQSAISSFARATVAGGE